MNPISIERSSKKPATTGQSLSIDILSASLKSLSFSLPSPMRLSSTPVLSPLNSQHVILNDFASNLTCCGTTFEDLHHLIYHLESCHTEPQCADYINIPQVLKTRLSPMDPAFVFPVSPENKITVSLADICRPFTPDPDQTDIEELSHDYVSGSETRDEEEEDSTFLAARPLPLPDISLKRRQFKSRPSVKRAKKTSDSDTQDESTESFTAPETAASVSDEGPKKEIAFLNPETKFLTPPSTPQPAAKRIKNVCNNMSVICPLTGERKYVCVVPTCKKQYKNANGLKYHLQHAHSDGVGVPEELLQLQKRKEAEEFRPYQCTIVNCYKRYKNLNGLKYHIEHAHASLLPPAPPSATSQASQGASSAGGVKSSHQQQWKPPTLPSGMNGPPPHPPHPSFLPMFNFHQRPSSSS